MTRIMVDMSATLIHHGHVRLLRAASEYGQVVVALTTDEEILEKKGYHPELSYDERREVLLSIVYVNEVVPSPWLIDESFMSAHCVDYLVHGSDNSNPVNSKRLILLPRTIGISSTLLRIKAVSVIAKKLESEFSFAQS